MNGALAAAGDVQQTPDHNAIASLELRDQFGNSATLADHRGTPVVVVVVTVRRLALIEQWERDLRERVPGLLFLNVADLPTDVPVDLERTAATLRKRVPPGVAVLLDPAHHWASTFALDTSLPNLLVFTASGELSVRVRGRWNAQLAAEVASALGEPGGPP